MAAFYVTMYDKRSNMAGDGRYYRVLGPFDAKDLAESMVGRAMAKANELDARAHFCSFGVCEYAAGDFTGPLNGLLL